MRLSEKTNGISTNINILRCIAAVLVIFCHSFYVASGQEDPLAIFCNKQVNFGGVAVAIFFFLSGFYVTKSLLKKNDVKEYLAKRCVRIFPQLWTVVFMAVLILGPVFTSRTLRDYFSDQETYLYLLNGFLVPIHNLPGVFENNIYGMAVNGALWTLSVEFIAYIGLAATLILSKYIFGNVKLQKALHVICVCVLFVSFSLFDVFLNNDFLLTVVRPLILFFIGALYYDYSDKIKLNIPIALTMFLLLVVSCKTEFLNYAMMVCLPYIIVTFSLGIRQVKFNGKILVISYEMYLFGWPIQQMITYFFGGQMNPYLNFLITLPIDVVLAFALYNVIDKRQKIMERIK